jgi:hypothetical protein
MCHHYGLIEVPGEPAISSTRPDQMQPESFARPGGFSGAIR